MSTIAQIFKNMNIWCDVYEHLPSQIGNKFCKWLFPSIHFYYSYAGYNFIHGSDSHVCESCSLTPKGRERQTWEMSHGDYNPAFLISSGHRQRPGIEGFPIALLALTAEAGPVHNTNGERLQTGNRQFIPVQEVIWRACNSMSSKEDMKWVTYKPCAQGGHGWVVKAERRPSVTRAQLAVV